MGFINTLFGNKKNKDNNHKSRYSERDQDTFYNFYYDRPSFEDYVGRKYNLPAYSDKYKTEEGFKLRELLLLIWWGKLKNGRKYDVIPPKYFYYNYNLDYDEVTDKFIKKGYLEIKDNKMLLTDSGKQLANKYKSLWEIHSFKGLPTNLDLDFTGWNTDEFSLLLYKSNLYYYKDFNDYYAKMNSFLKQSSYPETLTERNSEIKDNNFEIKYNNGIISDYEEKIKILENKINS